MAQIPEYNDEYLGRVYGNVLDQYDSATYNIRLYLLRDPDQRNRPEDFKLEPGNGVILAQTGVTGTQIDNVRIQGLGTVGTTQTKISFSVYQPGAADFIDQLNMARAFLGNPLSPSLTMFMEITFKGYEADPDDEDQGGAPTTIAGPFRYKLALATFRLEIDSTGTQYDFETIITDSLGYADRLFRLPKDINTVGSTITDHAQALQDALNKYHTDSSDAEVPDEIEIDVSQLLTAPAGSTTTVSAGSSLDFISDESLLTSAVSGAEDQNRLINEVLESTSNALEARDLEAESPSDSGNQTELIFEDDKFNVPEDKSIYDYFLILLSMNPEFYKKITRRETFGDLSAPIKQDQPFVSWLRVLCEVEEIGWDKKRKELARRYRYIPVLYKTVRTDMVSSVDELNYTDDDAVSRVRRMLETGMIYKSYNYIFSGQNDQIIDVDLNYNLGVGILAAPSGGTTGDSSVTNSATTAPSVPQTEDISPAGQQEVVKALRNLVERESLLSTFTNLGDLFGGVGDSLTQLANDAAGILGRTPAEISAVLTDTSGQAAQALLGELDSRQINQLNASLQITDPEANLLGDQGNPEITPDNPDGSEYTPESSGLLFAADFLNPENTPDIEDLLERGYLDYGDLDVNKETDIPQVCDSRTDERSITETATYRTLSPENRLFGYLVNQSVANQFFVNLNLSIRGDPWYLGLRHLVDQESENLQGPNADAPRLANLKTTEQAIALERDDNCFWFTMRSPRKYDPDWTDEDSELNSGYWRFDGINRSMSGLFRLRSYVCNFSGGQFTVDIESFREIPVNRTANKPIVETQTVSDDEPQLTETGQIVGEDGFVAGSI